MARLAERAYERLDPAQQEIALIDEEFEDKLRRMRAATAKRKAREREQEAAADREVSSLVSKKS